MIIVSANLENLEMKLGKWNLDMKLGNETWKWNLIMTFQWFYDDFWSRHWWTRAKDTSFCAKSVGFLIHLSTIIGCTWPSGCHIVITNVSWDMIMSYWSLIFLEFLKISGTAQNIPKSHFSCRSSTFRFFKNLSDVPVFFLELSESLELSKVVSMSRFPWMSWMSWMSEEHVLPECPECLNFHESP